MFFSFHWVSAFLWRLSSKSKEPVFTHCNKLWWGWLRVVSENCCSFLGEITHMAFGVERFMLEKHFIYKQTQNCFNYKCLDYRGSVTLQNRKVQNPKVLLCFQSLGCFLSLSKCHLPFRTFVLYRVYVCACEREKCVNVVLLFHSGEHWDWSLI